MHIFTEDMRTTRAFAKASLDIKHSSANHSSAFVPADIPLFNICTYLQHQFFNLAFIQADSSPLPCHHKNFHVSGNVKRTNRKFTNDI